MCLDFRRIAFMTLMLTSPTSCHSSRLVSQSFGSSGLMMFGKEQKYISSLLSLGSGFLQAEQPGFGRFSILFDDIPVHPLHTGHWKPSITQHRGQVFLHLASSLWMFSCNKTKLPRFAQGQSCLSQGRLLDFPFKASRSKRSGQCLFCFFYYISSFFMIFAVIAPPKFFEGNLGSFLTSQCWRDGMFAIYDVKTQMKAKTKRRMRWIDWMIRSNDGFGI